MILFLPIINALADSTTNLVSVGGLTTGALRVALIAPVLLILVAGQINRHGSSIGIYLFLAYLYALLWFSSDTILSANLYAKILISLLGFPLALRFVRTMRAFRLLSLATLAAVTILVLQVVVAQLFKLGTSTYVEDTFYLGGTISESFNVWALTILLWPVFLTVFRGRWQRLGINVLMIVTLILSIVLARRGIYLALAGGFAVYALATKQKNRLVLPILGVLLTLTLAWPSLAPLVSVRLERRLGRLNTSPLAHEGRLVETVIVFDRLLNTSVRHALFGSEAMNSAGFFTDNASRVPATLRERPIHVDFNRILHGAGIIGLLLYLLFHGLIAQQFTNEYRRVDKRQLPFDVRAAFWTILMAGFLISLSGSLVTIGYRFLLFLYLGAFIGLVENCNQRAEEPALAQPNVSGSSLTRG